MYPLTWEVFLDDVFLDGVRLPPSQFSTPDIQLSALIDTVRFLCLYLVSLAFTHYNYNQGNSLIRGPSDVVGIISSILGPEFPCNEPHTLAFSIGGQMFPVDPRDLIQPTYDNDASTCTTKLASANTPVVGRFLYSWSLGAPFLKRQVGC